jgi:hypothetical protein
MFYAAILDEENRVRKVPRRTFGTYGDWCVSLNEPLFMQQGKREYVINHIPTGMAAYMIRGLRMAQYIALRMGEDVPVDYSPTHEEDTTHNKYFLEQPISKEWLEWVKLVFGNAYWEYVSAKAK